MQKCSIFFLIFSIVGFTLLSACHASGKNKTAIKIYGWKVSEELILFSPTMTSYEDEAALEKAFNECKTFKGSTAKSTFIKVGKASLDSSKAKDPYLPCGTISPTYDPTYNYSTTNTFFNVGGIGANMAVNINYQFKDKICFDRPIFIAFFGENAPQHFDQAIIRSITNNALLVTGTVYAHWTAEENDIPQLIAYDTTATGEEELEIKKLGGFSSVAKISNSKRRLTHLFKYRITIDVCSGKVTMALSVDDGEYTTHQL
jgi:hypothetical protein